MSHVTRLTDLSIDHEVMEPLLSGSYAERQITSAHPFRCDGCGLVWAKRWHAETCEERGHKSSFDQVYHYRPEGYLTHGRLAEHRYTRYAIKRDRRIAAAAAEEVTS